MTKTVEIQNGANNSNAVKTEAHVRGGYKNKPVRTIVAIDFETAYDVSDKEPQKIWNGLIKLWCKTYGCETIKEVREYMNEPDDDRPDFEIDLFDDFCGKAIINEDGKHISPEAYAAKYNLRTF